MIERNVIIFRDTILPPSETFILSQGEGLRNFNSIYVGSRKIRGIEVPPDRSFFINDGTFLGRCRELLFKTTGLVSPGQLATIRKNRPLLIHAHFGPDGVLAQSLANACGLPLLVTFHGYDATSKDCCAKRSFFIHRKYLRRRRQLINGCQGIIAVSEFIKHKLMDQGVPENRITVHYIGVDLDYFRPDPVKQREPVVLFVGRLVEKKGCTFLIRAMRDVQARVADAELVIIGDGPLRGGLEDEARQSLRNCRFLGVQPPHGVREWMNRARVFSVPSVTAESGDAEGFGIVFAEAQAMGLPVVSFASGGIPEAVSHGTTGFLLGEKDWKGLGKHIISMFEDEALWQRMSRAAQERIRERFDLKKQNQLLEELYGTLLEKRETARKGE